MNENYLAGFATLRQQQSNEIFRLCPECHSDAIEPLHTGHFRCTDCGHCCSAEKTGKGRFFVCAKCHDEFIGKRGDEACRNEMQSYFGDVPEEETVVICDDCWQAIHPQRN